MVEGRLSMQARPEGKEGMSEQEKDNVEQIKEEQVEEEKIEEKQQDEAEPDVVPQNDQGVDRPIAS